MNSLPKIDDQEQNQPHYRVSFTHPPTRGMMQRFLDWGIRVLHDGLTMVLIYIIRVAVILAFGVGVIYVLNTYALPLFQCG